MKGLAARATSTNSIDVYTIDQCAAFLDERGFKMAAKALHEEVAKIMRAVEKQEVERAKVAAARRDLEKGRAT